MAVETGRKVGVDCSQIITYGTALMHADIPSPNDHVSRRDRARYTLERNSPKRIVEMLNESVSKRVEYEGVGVVQTMDLTGPYGYGGKMVFATDSSVWGKKPEEIQVGPDGRVPTKVIDDFPAELQQQYLLQVLANFYAQERSRLPGEPEDKPWKVVAAENAIKIVSNEKQSSPKTISQPHFHIYKTGGSWVDISDEPIPLRWRSRIEQNILNKPELVNPAVKRIAERMDKALGDDAQGLEFARRDKAPFGYTIVTPLKGSSYVIPQAQYLLKVMTAHYKAYQAEVELQLEMNPRLKRFKSLLPQPSFHRYIHRLDDGRLSVTFTPAFVESGAGVMEKAGSGISRHPDHPHLFGGAEALDQFMSNIGTLIYEIIEHGPVEIFKAHQHKPENGHQNGHRKE